MSLAAGRVLSHYRLIEKLGQGGMGVVWRAHDTRLERDVALKLLLDATATDDVRRARMLREARAVAGLRHECICPVFEIDEAEGLPFIAMELVEGRTLEETIAEGRLPIPEALRIADRILDAIEAAHAAGIVHRDLKPANVKLTPAGGVKLLDFGLARPFLDFGERSDDSHTVTELTRTGAVLGTPAYISPEQLRGEPAGPACDLFALGIVLYEMISGTRPFVGANAFILASAILHRPPALDALPLDVPPALAAVLLRLLEKDPGARFASAAQARDALANVSTSGTSEGPGRADRSIAVLRFADMSPGSDQGWFCDGIAEELIHTLTRLGRLRVVARASAFRFSPGDADVREIGRALGVESVLEGSVRRFGDRLRITTSLVRAGDATPVWSERFDREFQDVFRIQDEIAAAVADALQIHLLGPASPARAAAKPDLESYESFLRGLHFLNKRTESDLSAALECFHEAVRRDPDHAAAHGGVATAFALLAIYGTEAAREALPRARDAAERALAIDPDLVEARAALGCVRALLDRQFDDAERAFKDAIALNPGHPVPLHWFATNVLAPLGRFEEARAALERAWNLDPLSPAIQTSLGFVLHLERRHEAAVRRFRSVLDTEPDFALAHYFLGRALSCLGRHSEAVEALERAGESPEAISALGHVLAIGGETVRARALLDRLGEVDQRYVSRALLGVVHAALGEIDRAFELHERAVDDRATETIWLKVNPMLDPLREHTRFGSLLRRAGLGA